MDGFSIKTIIIGTNGVFRARRNPTETELFENVEEIWYPPKHAVAQAGRFNQAGVVRFYTSNRAFAALWEVQPSVGDRLTLIVAASKREAIELNCTHIGLHRSKEDAALLGPNGPLNLQTDPNFQAELRSMKVERKWVRLDDYFTELALTVPPPGTEQDFYKATNALEGIMGGINQHSALLYPSVATELNSFNLVLSPDYADEYFFASEAWTFDIVAHVDELAGASSSGRGYLGIRPVARSIDIRANGEIIWVPASDDDLPDIQQAIMRSKKVRYQRFPEAF